MARKNNLIELTLEVKRKGTEQITKYKKELFQLKQAANDLNKTLNATQKQLKQDVKNTSVKNLSADSQKAQAQIKKLEAALTKVTQELKDQKKAQSDLKKESNAKIQSVKAGAKAELKAYKKTQAALKKKKKEEEKANKTSEKSVSRLQRLGNAAATVNGPLNDVSGRINSLATGLKQTNPLLVITLTALSALVFAVPGATRAFAEMERQLGRIDAILKQTGNSAGFTVQQFESIAQELALNTLTSLRQARDSIGVLLSFPNIRTDNFERVLELSQDIAEVTGKDLKSSTERIAKAVTDPIKGITKLTEIGVVFTKEQEQLIKKTQAASGTFEAQGVILDVLASQYGGAAKGAAEGLAGTLDTIGQRFENIQLKLGAIVNKTGALDYIGDLAISFENLAEQIYQAEGAIDVLNAIVISIKNGSREQSELLSQTLKAQALLNKVEKEQKNKDTPLNVEAQSAVTGLDEIKKQIKQDLDELGEVQEDTLKRIQNFEKKTQKDLKNQIKTNNSLISASIAESIRARARALVDTGDYTEEQFKLLEKNGAFDEDRFKEIVDDVPLLGDKQKDTINIFKKAFEAISIDLGTEEGKLDAQILALQEKVQKDIPEIFDLRTDISTKSTEELRKVAENDLSVIVESLEKQKDESLRIENERQKELKKLREQNSKELEKIALREKQQELDVEAEIVNRKIKKDSDSVTLQNEKLRIQNEKEILSLKVREIELEKQRTAATQRANKLRTDNPELSDSQIEKITADSDKPFTNTLGEIERTTREIDNLNSKINKLEESLSKEQKFNIDINNQKINDQINTILEDNSIKQKELAARLQGDTEESLENQLSVIDEKYDKALKNIEERNGEIPDNVLDEISESKALEKANTTFDNVKKRFKELSEEFVKGKISLDSFIESTEKLNETLENTGKDVNIEIPELDITESLQKNVKEGSKEISDEISNILSKVEDADLSESFALKRSALDRLKEYSDELLEIKELNPQIDVSQALRDVKNLKEEIKETRNQTEKIFKGLSDDFADEFADGIVKMATEGGQSIRNVLKSSVAEAFGNYAAERLKEAVFAGLSAGLEALTGTFLEDFVSELNFAEFFGGEDEDEAINYKKVNKAQYDALEKNTKNIQKVEVTNGEEVGKKEGEANKGVKDKDDDFGKKALGAIKDGFGGDGGGDLLESGFDFLKGGSGFDGFGLSSFGDFFSNLFGGFEFGDIFGGFDLGGLFDGFDLGGLFGGGDGGFDLGGLFSGFDLGGLFGGSGSGGFLDGLSNLFSDFLFNFDGLFSMFEGGIFEGFDLSGIFDGFSLGNIFDGISLEGIFDGFSFGGIFDGFEGFDLGSLSGIFDNFLSGFKGIFDGFDLSGISANLSNAFSALQSSGGGKCGIIGSALGTLTGGIFHTGGMVGSNCGGSCGNSVQISQSLLKNAPKYHEGGYTGSNLKSDEMAAILQKGEYVIDRKTTQDMLKTKGGGSNNSGSQVNITNVVGTDDIAKSLSESRISQDNTVNDIKARSSEIKNYLNR